MSASMLLMVALVGVLLVVVSRALLSAVEAATSGRYGGDPAGCPCGRRAWLASRRDAFQGGEAGFYRLSSLRWWPDRRLSRRRLEIVARRSPRGDEFDIMTDQIVVLELRDTAPGSPPGI